MTTPDPEASVTIFTTAWCGSCRQAKRFLDDRAISYREIDIESDPAAAALAKDGHWSFLFCECGGIYPEFLPNAGRTRPRRPLNTLRTQSQDAPNAPRTCPWIFHKLLSNP